MTNQVLLFTLDGCGHCKNLKERLNNESLPFTEVEVNKNQELWNKIVEQRISFYRHFILNKTTQIGDHFFVPKKILKMMTRRSS
jgi:glutaredoxin